MHKLMTKVHVQIIIGIFTSTHFNHEFTKDTQPYIYPPYLKYACYVTHCIQP